MIQNPILTVEQNIIDLKEITFLRFIFCTFKKVEFIEILKNFNFI